MIEFLTQGHEWPNWGLFLWSLTIYFVGYMKAGPY